MQSANFLVTGLWSQLCIKEAAGLCEANEVTNTKKHNFTNIDPTSEWKVRKDATFFAYCDNETVHGFEWNNFPQHMIPKGQLVCCDMSSNFASRRVDWSKYDVVYLGAQKNIGPSGLTIVIARHSVIDRKPRGDIICTNNWQLARASPNMYHNTPCNYAIYVAGLNIAHMLAEGGIDRQAKKAQVRSSMVYSVIDGSDGFYVNKISKDFRSRMNIVFRVCNDAALEKDFLTQAHSRGLVELAGHPALGGIRASLYNAMPIEGAEALCKFMREFQAKHSGRPRL